MKNYPFLEHALDTMMMNFIPYHLLVKTRIHYQDSCTITLAYEFQDVLCFHTASLTTAR